MTGDWLFVAFDMAMVALACALGWAARKAARAKPKTMHRNRPNRKELITA
ncbi:hypothetical protein IL54_3828 [Sphingobium sp. ba1]|nr:hypothetical protein IL54_3828 [Sphingobium sp. ba1]